MYQGTFTALVTPFRGDVVDESALRRLVAEQIEAGVSGLVPCGTTGESPTITQQEHQRIISVVVDECKGRIPVIAGAGTASTAKSIELALSARAAGADGILLVMPYYNRPTQRGLVEHVRAVCSAASLPTMLYNIPGRTGVDLSLESLDALSSVPEIVAIKEATGNVLRAQQIVAAFGSRFSVLSGDDALTVPMLAVGGSGVVSVTSNVYPKAVSAVVASWQRGDAREAERLHRALLPVHDAMFVESNPGPAKFALALHGKVAPEVRLPLVWPTEDSQQKVRAALRSYEASETYVADQAPPKFDVPEVRS